MFLFLVRRRYRRLILGPHVAALDAQGTGGVDTHERAGTRHLGRVIEDGPLLERCQGCLDLTEALVDVLWDLVGFGVALLQLVELGLQDIAGSHLVLGHRHFGAAEAAQPVRVAVGEVGRDLDPPPALRAHGLGFAPQLLGNEPIQERRILQPAAVVGLEQVAEDDAARGLVVGETHELRPLVGSAHRVLRQQPTNLVGLPDRGPLQSFPYLRLARVVGVDSERHQLVERHAILGVDLEQLGRHGGEPQALAHDGNRDEERRGDLFFGGSSVAVAFPSGMRGRRVRLPAVILRDRGRCGKADLCHRTNPLTRESASRKMVLGRGRAPIEMR